MIVDKELPIHPAANLFPQMNEQGFQALKADINQNGLQEPIIIYQGQILDGRHRYRACKDLGIEPSLQQFEGTDPQALVVSMNLNRRHLNPSQCALIAARLAHSKHGGNRSKPQKCGLTHSQAAARLNVGLRSVEKASALLNDEKTGELSPAVLKAVSEGKMSLAKAEKIAKLPSEKQSEFLLSKDRKAVPRKRKANLRERSDSQLQQISLEAERLSSRTLEVIRRAHDGGRVTPAQIELALEICQSVVERFDVAIDILQQISAQVSDRNQNKLPKHIHEPAQNIEPIPKEQIPSSAPAEEEVCLD